MSYEPKTYRKDGGDTFVVASGGKIEIESGGTITNAGNSTITGLTDIAYSSASTNGATSIQPFKLVTTMTGAGGVGGRGLFELNTNVAMGGWANALKAHTKFGASGKVTGLASSLCLEMDLSAGCAAGNYAPLEIELNLGNGALTGTKTSLIYASVNGAAAGTFDDNGVVLSLNGVTIGANHVFQASAKAAINATHAMKISVLGVDYFIPCHTSAAFGV